MAVLSVGGEFQTARELGEQLLSWPNANAPALLLEAHGALGGTLLYLGDYAAPECLEQGVALTTRRHSAPRRWVAGALGVRCLPYAATPCGALGIRPRLCGESGGPGPGPGAVASL